MADREFETGDKVEWDSHGGKDPQYRVRSEKCGNDAVHRPDALRRRK